MCVCVWIIRIKTNFVRFPISPRILPVNFIMFTKCHYPPTKKETSERFLLDLIMFLEIFNGSQWHMVYSLRNHEEETSRGTRLSVTCALGVNKPWQVSKKAYFSVYISIWLGLGFRRHAFLVLRIFQIFSYEHLNWWF